MGPGPSGALARDRPSRSGHDPRPRPDPGSRRDGRSGRPGEGGPVREIPGDRRLSPGDLRRRPSRKPGRGPVPDRPGEGVLGRSSPDGRHDRRGHRRGDGPPARSVVGRPRAGRLDGLRRLARRRRPVERQERRGGLAGRPGIPGPPGRRRLGRDPPPPGHDPRNRPQGAWGPAANSSSPCSIDG